MTAVSAKVSRSADVKRAPAAAQVLSAPSTPFGRLPVEVHIGDTRAILPKLGLAGKVDLIFADPPFNWNRAYDKWDDNLPREDYLDFTYNWLSACEKLLRPGGAFWVNIPDDSAAEIVVHLKRLGLEMENWCIWHYRFGQNTKSRFINSKVHALYFVKPGEAEDGRGRTWNADTILEASDRATTYFDHRTLDKKDGMPAGMRVPMDVWYGRYWGRIQGNNKERRANHDNQLPEVYLERVIRACSNEGDLVVDPFVGSGTTAVMAHALGRRFVGTEFSKANAESAFERITKLGPVVRDVSGGAESSAIFPPRRTRAGTRASTVREAAEALEHPVAAAKKRGPRQGSKKA